MVGPGDLAAPGGRQVFPAITRISRNPDDENKYQQLILDPTAVAPNAQVQLKFSQRSDGSNELLFPTAPAAVVINQPHRLSVSEPTDGYDSYLQPIGAQPPGHNWNSASIYDPGTQTYSPPYDIPFDSRPELLTDGITPQYKVVYLQRLANPSLPFDAVANPYRTIDSMPVDLFAYNGWEDPQIVEMGPGGVKITNQIGQTPTLPPLRSRERGGQLRNYTQPLPPPLVYPLSSCLTMSGRRSH